MISHLVALICGSVCESNKELAAREGVEVLGGVTFNPVFIPDLRLFALGVHLFDELIEVT